MRGILVHSHALPRELRFIPAHAGNSCITAMGGVVQPVHPRACGEFEELQEAVLISNGSSPRMRGILRLRRVRHGSGRFIPAHAGNSRGRPAAGGRGTVHPRACGEFCSRIKRSISSCGSSPRMRGILSQHAHRHGRFRFIPAHAGNSRPAISRKEPVTVHPRACGEFGYACAGCRICNGSSPRMRGILERLERLADNPRFIPAHAGNSK